MSSTNQWIDRMRLAGAFMVVAIHTGPWSGISERLEFGVTYCLGRVAVPFFFMVTGYFVLSRAEKVGSYIARMLGWYGLATLLYLPINLYAGKRVESVGELLQDIFFDGTFYHLWYFPALLLGCGIVTALWRLCGEGQCGLIAGILYLAGVLGDSYGELVMGTDIGRHFYDQLFAFSDYTRNGIFFAPMFLWLGWKLRNDREIGRVGQSLISVRKCGWSLLISLILLLAEGFWTYEMGWQRHNSMYFMLVPVLYFLFQLLLGSASHWGLNKGQKGWQRDLSLWIYLLHPMVIVAVRGLGKLLDLTGLLVENRPVYFAAVCAGSTALAALVLQTRKVGKGNDGKKQSMGRA